MMYWFYKDWRFFLSGEPEAKYFSVPDAGGQADMVPRDAAQLAWAVQHIEGLPGLRRYWNVSWEITSPAGLEALVDLWARVGGTYEPERWKESWTMGPWKAVLKRKLVGTLFHFESEPGADAPSPYAVEQDAWAEAHLGGLPGLRRAGPVWEVLSEEGMSAVRAAWKAAGGNLAPITFPWRSP
jgi:hypothetical protein